MGNGFLHGQSGGNGDVLLDYECLEVSAGSDVVTFNFDKPIKAIIMSPRYNYTTSSKVNTYQGYTVIFPKKNQIVVWSGSSSTPTLKTDYDFLDTEYYIRTSNYTPSTFITDTSEDSGSNYVKFKITDNYCSITIGGTDGVSQPIKTMILY